MVVFGCSSTEEEKREKNIVINRKKEREGAKREIFKKRFRRER